MTALRVVFLGLAGLALASGAAAQEEPEPLTFGTTAEVVAIQVFVTDGDGRAVGGLTAEDFRVRDRGDERPVAALVEVDPEAPTLPEFGGRSMAAAARRQFLLLFDLSFSDPQGLLRARRAAEELVSEQLGPSDLAAVATFSVQTGMQTLVGFTTDRDQARRAIQTLGIGDLRRVRDPLNLAYFLGEPVGPGGGSAYEKPGEGADAQFNDLIRTFSVAFGRMEEADYQRQARVFIDAISALGESLAELGGSKQVILFSSGFHQSLLIGQQGVDAIENARASTEGRLWEVSENQFGNPFVRDAMEDMVRAVRASGTVIHAVDVSGLAESNEARLEGRIANSGRESLGAISRDSGGQLIKDTNDLEAGLGRILDATRRYYVLGFSPAAFEKPGRFHELDVDVRRKGLRVTSRSGYVEPDPNRKTAPDRLSAAEAIAKGLVGGELGLRVLSVPYRNSAGEPRLPLVIEIDGETLMRGVTAPALQLELYGYSLGPEGSVEDAVALQPALDLAGAGDRIRSHGVRVLTSLRVPPGRHDLRVLVRDGRGREGLVRVEAVLPDPEAEAILLGPPLFMDAPTAGVVIPSGSLANRQPEIPFRVGDEAFAPVPYPRLANGETRQVCVVFRAPDAMPDAGFRVGVQLVDREGAATRVGRIELERAVVDSDGFRRYVLLVTPEDVASGEYAFEVSLTDPASGAVARSALPVRFD